MQKTSTITTFTLPAGQVAIFERGGKGTANVDPTGRANVYTIGEQEAFLGPFSKPVDIVVTPIHPVSYRIDNDSDMSDQSGSLSGSIAVTDDGLRIAGVQLTQDQAAIIRAGIGITHDSAAELSADLADSGIGLGADIVGFMTTGTGAVARSMQDKARDVVSVLDFDGADPTGATSSTAAFSNAIATGRSVYVPPGDYRLDTRLDIAAKNVKIYGDGNSSRIFSATLVSPVKFLNCSGATFDGLFFETTVVSASNSVFGVVFSDNAELTNIKFIRCKFRAATANTNAVKIINETAAIADGISFIDCEFLDIGRMAIEFQNHNDADSVHRYRRVKVDGCHFKNIGVIGTYGMGVSLSGYGELCKVINNDFDNCWSVGVEGVGVKDSIFDNNTFSGFGTRNYVPFSFTGSRVMSGLTFSRNKVTGPTAGRWQVYSVNDSVFSDNLLRSGGFFLRNVNDCLFEKNRVYQHEASPNSVFIEGASARNRFTACVFDGSLAAIANQSTVAHSVGVVDTTYEGCRIVKSAVAGANTDSASTNTRYENCVIDGVLYAEYLPTRVRRGILYIQSVAGVSKLTIEGIAGASWTNRMIRFTVSGVATDSTGRVAAARHIEVRGQGTNNPEIGGTATLMESGCTITYTKTVGTLVIICTNSLAQDALHRWEYEVVGPAVGAISIAT